MHAEDLTGNCDLPVPRLRDEMLRRAQLTLAEARALSTLLDHLENGLIMLHAASATLRTPFGFSQSVPDSSAEAHTLSLGQPSRKSEAG